MPFSLFQDSPESYRFDTGYQPTAAAQGLTLEDLIKPALRIEYPEPPQPISRADQLDQERRRQLRMQAILLAAQGLGQGASNGQIGTALAGAAGQQQDFQAEMIARARAEQQGTYQASRQAAEHELEQRRAAQEEERERRSAEATLETVQRIAAADPELGARAEQAAREGDHKALSALLAELPKRKALRGYHLNPDDPFADDTMKAIIEQDSKLRTERAYKEEGLERYFQEPGQSVDEQVERAGRIAEAQARAYAKYRQTGDAKDLRRFYEVNGTPGLVSLDESGEPTFTPAKGAPAAPKKYVRVPDDPMTEENEGGWYDPTDPGAGPLRAKPKPPSPPKPQQGKPAPQKGGTKPPAAASPQAQPKKGEAQARSEIMATVARRMPQASPAERSRIAKQMLDAWRAKNR